MGEPAYRRLLTSLPDIQPTDIDMKTHKSLMGLAIAGLFAFVLMALPARAQDGLEMPDWMTVDKAAKTVTLDIVAGKTDANNHWNFNGYARGEATIVVPEGFTVTLNFKNEDPVMVHSIGVGQRMDAFPAMFENPSPVFAGAMSSNPTDMVNATKTGASETLTFVVDKAGDYALICFIPAHATTGMWIGFSVSSDGKAGLVKGNA